MMINLQLKATLLAIAKADQTMRNNAAQTNGKWDDSLDKKHTQQLKLIIAEHGWPTIPLVGAEASIDAWLVVQHADHDPLFQKECLALMKTLPTDEISLRNIAYLEDRILVGEQKTQLYGTQFQGSGTNLKPQPIKDRVNLDKRRKLIELEPFAQYEKIMLKTYGSN